MTPSGLVPGGPARGVAVMLAVLLGFPPAVALAAPSEPPAGREPGYQQVLPEDPASIVQGDDACAVLTDEEIVRATEGSTILSRSPGPQDFLPAGCAWEVEVEGALSSGSIYLGVATTGGRQHYDTMAPFDDIGDPIAGVGEEAIDPAGIGSILAVQGDTAVSVQYVAFGARPSSLVSRALGWVALSRLTSAPAPLGELALTNSDVMRAVGLLSEAGVTTRIRPSDAPLVGVADPSRVELLRFQARNLALEAAAGGGTLGVELDEYAEATGSPPLSDLFSAWLAGADTPASRAAARLVTGQSADDPTQLVVPGLAMAMFVADIVGPANGPVASIVAGAGADAGPLAAAGGDFCGQVGAYLSAVLGGILDPDIALEPEWLAAAIAREAGATIDADGLRRAVGALALLVYATSISRPWVATLSAVPSEVHYIVDDDELTAPSKVFSLIVNVGEGVVAEEAGECADLAGADLAGQGDTEGIPVGWVLPELQPHAVDVAGDLELEDRGQFAAANLEYQTRGETGEAHRDGTLRQAFAHVTGIVRRGEIEEIEEAVRLLLTGGGLGAAGSTVEAEYERLRPALRDLLYPRATARVEVSWHEAPDPTPEPSPSDAVWVHVDRAAIGEAVQEARVVELLACSGPYGPWSGFLRVGGIGPVPLSELPVSFSFPASGGEQTATTSTGGIDPGSFRDHIRGALRHRRVGGWDDDGAHHQRHRERAGPGTGADRGHQRQRRPAVAADRTRTRGSVRFVAGSGPGTTWAWRPP